MEAARRHAATTVCVESSLSGDMVGLNYAAT